MTMKIEEQVLSREQMAHLKELGVDTSDASMIWVSYDAKDGTGRRYLTINNDMSREIARMMNGVIGSFVPTYTIGDLIEKLPKSENIGELLIEFGNSDLGYGDWDCSELYGINGQQNFKDKPLKDALYNLLCWVAENHKELIK